MSRQRKRPYSEVMPVAQRVVDALSPHCDRIAIAGSLRRQREMIGDIEIVALPTRLTDLFGQPTDDPTTLDVFFEKKGVKLRKNGRKFKQFQYGAYTVDLFLPATPAHWGCVYMIRTGSASFSRWMVSRPHFRFKDGLLYDGSWQHIPTPEESDVFEALGLPFIPPEMRDDEAWLDLL